MLGRPLIRLQCHEGLDLAGAAYEWNYARQMLEIRLAEAARRRGAIRDRLAQELFSDRFLIRRALLQAIDPRNAVRAGAADRRARPRRRAFRGLPARGAERLPDHDPRDRHRQGGDAADRRADQQPHARDPRRREAPLPVPLGGLSRRRSARRRSWRAACPARRNGWRAEIVAFVQRLREIELYKLPGIAETIEWTRALMELDAVVLDPADHQPHAGRAAEVPGRHRQGAGRRGGTPAGAGAAGRRREHRMSPVGHAGSHSMTGFGPLPTFAVRQVSGTSRRRGARVLRPTSRSATAALVALWHQHPLGMQAAWRPRMGPAPAGAATALHCPGGARRPVAPGAGHGAAAPFAVARPAPRRVMGRAVDPGTAGQPERSPGRLP